MTRARMLVTGASGFVGRAVVERATAEGIAVRAAVRRPVENLAAGASMALAPDLGPAADWSAAVRGVGVVVHAAARVHVMRDPSLDPLAEFRRANVDGSIALARAAAEAGVRRFVFVSSIKVNGEITAPNHPFSASDTPQPRDAYGTSKYEAEVALRALGAERGMEVVIVRPVLVYGPGVKANFARMMRWIAWGMPLPFGSVDNRRSVVSVGNLADLIVLAAQHPAAVGRALLASDGEDFSTAELMRRLGDAMQRPARLIPIPVSLMAFAANALGRRDFVARVLCSLQVDISETTQALGWRPPQSTDTALIETASWFVDTHRTNG